ARALDPPAPPPRRPPRDLLRDGPRPVGELAEALPVSRPAVSQHLAVLKAAGLVADRAAGRRRRDAVDPGGPDALGAYLEGLWGQALASYRQTAEGGAEPTEEKGER